ncbi:MAG: CotH kinase family protein [Gammaproteobacteria bacterium]|nr:CotH kinase family protein [Gammaproteobacteria bacterium]
MKVVLRTGLLTLGLALLSACGGGGSGASPDFALASGTAALAVQGNSTGIITVTALRTGGHKAAIELSLEAPPAGVTATGVIPKDSSYGTLTISVSAAAAVQGHALTVKGMSGNLVHTTPTTVALTVTPAPPGTNRLTAFMVESAPHPLLLPFRGPADVEQTPAGGRIAATLPGGTAAVVSVSFVTDGGTVFVSGRPVSSPATLDLTTVRELLVVDATGNARRYTLDIGDSGIPSVIIRSTGGVPIDSKDFYVTGDITIIGGSTSYAQPLPTSTMKIKGRGNSTWGQPKKPYRFTLDASAAVLGLPAAKNWVLLASYFDMSLMRTQLAFDVARRLTNLSFTPSALPVDLFLNGAYQGTYTVGEQMEIGSGRIPVEKPTTLDDTGYWLEANLRSPLEGGVAGVDYFTTTDGQIFDYKSPKADSLTPGQKAYIQAMVQQIEDGLKSGVPGASLVDVPSFIDWLIVQELFKNQDSMFMSSVNLYRDKGQKMAMGPIWDFDLGAGNSNYGAIGGYALNDWHGWFPTYAPWYEGLFREAEFRAAFKARWNEVKGTLQAEVAASITRQRALLAKSQKLNFQRWPVLGVGTWATPPELLAANTWEAQVVALQVWVGNRFQWMDQAINATY